jgi:hypothetical protein
LKRVTAPRQSGSRRTALACALVASVAAALLPVAAPGQPPPAPPAPAGEAAPAASAPIEGFRQARFGMTEQQVRQTVRRDFPAAAARLSRSTHPREKTTVLALTVEDLLPDAGPARISYILGYASKQLVQVNIVWASDGRTAARDEGIVEAANLLRDHFRAQHRAPPYEVVENLRIGDNAILVFRAKQADGRMVLLLLTGAPASRRAEPGAAPVPPPLTLQLSYIRDHVRPDIFQIERGRF